MTSFKRVSDMMYKNAPWLAGESFQSKILVDKGETRLSLSYYIMFYVYWCHTVVGMYA